MRYRLLALLLSGSSLLPASALAAPHGDFEALSFLADLFVPDARFEFGRGGSGWSVSWPFAVDLEQLAPDTPLIASVVVEPQWQVSDHVFRLLLAARTAFRFTKWAGTTIEYGAVIAEDGHGGFLGATLSWYRRGYAPNHPFVSLHTRSIWTQGGWRAELALVREWPLGFIWSQ